LKQSKQKQTSSSKRVRHHIMFTRVVSGASRVGNALTKVSSRKFGSHSADPAQLHAEMMQARTWAIATVPVVGLVSLLAWYGHRKEHEMHAKIPNYDFPFMGKMNKPMYFYWYSTPQCTFFNFQCRNYYKAQMKAAKEAAKLAKKQGGSGASTAPAKAAHH